MFKNYLKIAFRNLLKHKGHSFINISGLAVGMACCILILLWVQDEFSYDRYHKNAKRIYRVVQEMKRPDGISNTAITPVTLGPALHNDYPEVTEAVRIYPRNELAISYQDKRFYEDHFFVVDPAIFKMFSFSFVKGNKIFALKDPYSVVITEEISKKYFGREDPMGKVITINDANDYKVAGVIENIPHNSHFRFDFLTPFVTLKENGWSGLDSWWNNSFYTYILLPKRFPQTELENKLPDFIDKHINTQNNPYNFEINYRLQSLTRIHLYSHLENEIEPNSDIAYIYVFSAIGFFILLIACINFINLTTARTANRSKEIGIRKVVGANRVQLIKQFLGETILLALIALVVSVVLVELTLPAFNFIVDKKLENNYYDNPFLLIGFMGIVLFVGIVSGSYPAFLLSGFHPVSVLKAVPKKRVKSFRLRSTLVVFQFSILTCLIICSGIISNQLKYLRNKKLGFNKNHAVIIPLHDRSLRGKIEIIKNDINKNHNILSASLSSEVPGRCRQGYIMLPDGTQNNKNLAMNAIYIDPNFVETLGIKITAGRNFSKDHASDINSACIINETAAKKIGWNSPIGKQLVRRWRSWKTTVIGVTEDFNFLSLHQEIEPLVLYMGRPNWFRYLIIKIRPDNISNTLNFLKNRWKDFAPSHPFEYFFLDDYIHKLYRAEEKLGKIFGYFSFLAIFIACLGLLSLVSHSAEQRTKEIGIRKVLGSSVSGIIVLLTRDFTKWVIIANVIAWPSAYYFMNKWLQNFAYRIDIGIWTFLLAGALALVIALLTVSYQVIKVATANPVEALKYE